MTDKGLQPGQVNRGQWDHEGGGSRGKKRSQGEAAVVALARIRSVDRSRDRYVEREMRLTLS